LEIYWNIGRDISERQEERWGQSIVPVLSAELQFIYAIYCNTAQNAVS
jgi:hypothetical protein